MDNRDVIQKEIVTRYGGDGRYFRQSYNESGLEAVKHLREKFPLKKTAVYHHYSPHGLQRYMLIGDLFKSYLSGRILDVGSRENVISEALGLKAELVDKNASSVTPTDLESGQLPYENKSFDTVVCLDTLEHVDHLHEVFEELLRVSKGVVIFSLPNTWRKTFRQMLKGRSMQGAYGLPPEKPMDRHKWFFNPEEVKDFIFYRSVCANVPYEVKEVICHFDIEKPWHPIMYRLLTRIVPRHAQNLFVNTTFFVLEPKHSEYKV